MKKKFDYTRTELIFLLTSVMNMPIIGFFLLNIESDVFGLYMGLWLTITGGFAWVHIKLRKYRELFFPDE